MLLGKVLGVRRVKGLRDETMRFLFARSDSRVREVLRCVYEALQEKGYDPVSQMVGYLLSGDPTYITSHQGARNMIRELDRDKVLEELVSAYIQPVSEGKVDHM